MEVTLLYAAAALRYTARMLALLITSLRMCIMVTELISEQSRWKLCRLSRHSVLQCFC